MAAAVTFGIVAVLLSGTPPTLSPHLAPGASRPIEVSWIAIGLGILVLLLAWIGYRIYLRLQSTTANVPLQALVPVLAVFLAVILMLALLHLAGSGAPTPTQPGHENGTAGHPPPPPSGGNNSTVNWSRTGALPGLPAWAPYALLGIAVAIIALVALPYLIVRADRRADEASEGAVAQEALAAVRSALSQLDRQRGTDPRAVIIALYQRLLSALGNGIGAVEPKTAREIEQASVNLLGVGAATARELRRLFEEARYSTRPMGPSEAERARRALADALADLSRSQGSV